jgi:DNA-binding response OmpR family regulator
MRILVIEDDQELGMQIVKRLKDAGYEPTWLKEGRRVAESAVANVELVILDLMLPGVYGLDVLKDLRTFSEVPVLVLSARNDTSDKVRALKLGADDYLTKPFWPEELLEGVAARLRRPTMRCKDVMEIGPLRSTFWDPAGRLGRYVPHARVISHRDVTKTLSRADF